MSFARRNVVVDVGIYRKLVNIWWHFSENNRQKVSKNVSHQEQGVSQKISLAYAKIKNNFKISD